jgi:cell division protein ZapE
MEAIQLGGDAVPVAKSEERLGAVTGLLSLDDLIAGLPPRADAETLLTKFVPPPRFADKRFANYEPRHPTQAEALERVVAEARALRDRTAPGSFGRLRALVSARARGRGIYLDGGFGVGKTHLLAAMWHESPDPKTYLSFDELVYYLGLVGVSRAQAAFSDRKLVAVDEWELDDPGNLKLALAFLRGALADGVTVVVTSNTLPIDLGAGRFSQKDFLSEIEELANAFEVVRMEGEDYRRRHFETAPGHEYYLSSAELTRLANESGPGALLADFGNLISALRTVHPIRYQDVIERIDALHLKGVEQIANLPDGLRWVHFIDSLYDSGVPAAASSEIALADLFPRAFFDGPFARKFSRCLSRSAEMLGARRLENVTPP